MSLTGKCVLINVSHLEGWPYINQTHASLTLPLPTAIRLERTAQWSNKFLHFPEPPFLNPEDGSDIDAVHCSMRGNVYVPWHMVDTRHDQRLLLCLTKDTGDMGLIKLSKSADILEPGSSCLRVQLADRRSTARPPCPTAICSVLIHIVYVLSHLTNVHWTK